MYKSVSGQRGFVMQALMGLIAFVAIYSVAYPMYQVTLVRSKMAEALTLTSDAKIKLNEFYIMKNRFPRNSREAGNLQAVTLTKPKFVSNIKVDFKNKENDIVIQVYFNEGEIPESDSLADFLYLAGNNSSDAGSIIEWTCGVEGIDPKYLPSTC